MGYDVEAAADELMLTTDEIKEVFECYFEDVVELIASCYSANLERDYVIVAKKVHALKGSSENLRMHETAVMIIELEGMSKRQEGAEIAQYLPKIEQQIDVVKAEIDVFYRTRAKGS